MLSLFLRTLVTTIVAGAVARSDAVLPQQPDLNFQQRIGPDQEDSTHHVVGAWQHYEEPPALESLEQLFRQLTSDGIVEANAEPALWLFKSGRRKLDISDYTQPYSDSSPLAEAPNFSDSSKGTAALEIEVFTIGGTPYFTTNIALGTPAQPFRALVDLNLDGTFVRSPKCRSVDCGRGFLYDGSKSTTRGPLSRRFERRAPGWTVAGSATTDVLHLVNIQVPSASFGEIEEYFGDDLWYYALSSVVDGAIGLTSPESNTSAYFPAEGPNTLHDLLRSHTPRHNVFTLTLPKRFGERGALQVGSIPDVKPDEIARVPFAKSSSAELANTWHIPLNSISLGGSSGHRFPLKSVYARLDLGTAIGFSAEITKQVLKALNAAPTSYFNGAEVDCNTRESLPDLVLGLGRHNIVLTKDDYGSERMVFGRRLCIVHIVSMAEGVDSAVLGTVLLKKFHALFDMEAQELGLIARQ